MENLDINQASFVVACCLNCVALQHQLGELVLLVEILDLVLEELRVAFLKVLLAPWWPPWTWWMNGITKTATQSLKYVPKNKT